MQWAVCSEVGASERAELISSLLFSFAPPAIEASAWGSSLHAALHRNHALALALPSGTLPPPSPFCDPAAAAAFRPF